MRHEGWLRGSGMNQGHGTEGQRLAKEPKAHTKEERQETEVLLQTWASRVTHLNSLSCSSFLRQKVG